MTFNWLEKALEKLRKQVLSTELNIRHTNTKYSS